VQQLKGRTYTNSNFSDCFQAGAFSVLIFHSLCKLTMPHIRYLQKGQFQRPLEEHPALCENRTIRTANN